MEGKNIWTRSPSFVHRVYVSTYAMTHQLFAGLTTRDTTFVLGLLSWLNFGPRRKGFGGPMALEGR
jgi:hypothetical protein